MYKSTKSHIYKHGSITLFFSMPTNKSSEMFSLGNLIFIDVFDFFILAKEKATLYAHKFTRVIPYNCYFRFHNRFGNNI